MDTVHGSLSDIAMAQRYGVRFVHLSDRPILVTKDFVQQTMPENVMNSDATNSYGFLHRLDAGA